MNWEKPFRWLFGQACSKRASRGHVRPAPHLHRAQLGVRQPEEKASPTNLSLLSGMPALTNRPSWDAEKLGSVASIALSKASAQDSGADAVAAYSPAAELQAARPRLLFSRYDVTADTSVGTAGTSDDDGSDSAAPNFPRAAETPVLGAEPQLGAATGTASSLGGGTSSWFVSNSVNSAGSIFLTGPTFAAPSASHGFVPSGTPGPSPGVQRSATLGPAKIGRSQSLIGTRLATPRAETAAPQIVATTSGDTALATSPPPGRTTPPLSGSPYIVGNSFPPDILPRLYSNALADPANEPELTVDPSQGGDPMSVAFSRAGVRYVDGAVQITAAADLSSDGFLPFGQTRSWSNAAYASTNSNGSGWVDSQLPYLVQQSLAASIALVGSATNAYIFDYNSTSGNYTPAISC